MYSAEPSFSLQKLKVRITIPSRQRVVKPDKIDTTESLPPGVAAHRVSGVVAALLPLGEPEHSVRAKELLLEQAAKKLEEAGIREQLPYLAWQVTDHGHSWASGDEFDYAESFACSVCGDANHSGAVLVKKPKGMHFQYALSIEISLFLPGMGYRWRDRLAYAWRRFWQILRTREDCLTVEIAHEDVTRFKDLLKKL